uniref:Pericentrin-like n=1 Tax=Crassostrea virginica TaxID=6565 RepID=A0A8B8C0D2_CRAVI|nr:pericentrin-like [Crassostrea virginica]
MGAYPSLEHLYTTARHRRPFTVFRSAARVVVAVSRIRCLVKKWKRATRDRSTAVVELEHRGPPSRKVLSSLSSSPTKPVIPFRARRVRITEPEPSSYHDDYISRLESLQQRMSGMESGPPKSRLFPRR